MILVDSGVWVDFFRGVESFSTQRLAQLVQSHAVGVGDLMLVEVLQGFTSDREYAEAGRLMALFPLVTIVDGKLAVKAAENFRALRRRGITVRKTIDTLIATRCIVDGHQLLYSDRDFDPFVEHLGLQPCPAR